MGPASDDLAGTRWRVSDAPGAPALDHLDERAAPTLSFADGRVAGFSGCNLLSGGYERDGDRLTLGPLVTTMKACPHPADIVERTFLERLDSVTTAIVRDGVLVLRDDHAADVLHFAAVPALNLQGTSWRITAVNTGGQAVSSVLDGSELTLTFTDAATVAGDTGCNRFRGAVAIGPDDLLSIGPLLTTRRGCPDDQSAEQERALLTALGAVSRVQADRAELELRDQNDTLQVLLRRI